MQADKLCCVLLRDACLLLAADAGHAVSSFLFLAPRACFFFRVVLFAAAEEEHVKLLPVAGELQQLDMVGKLCLQFWITEATCRMCGCACRLWHFELLRCSKEQPIARQPWDREVRTLKLKGFNPNMNTSRLKVLSPQSFVWRGHDCYHFGGSSLDSIWIGFQLCISFSLGFVFHEHLRTSVRRLGALRM